MEMKKPPFAIPSGKPPFGGKLPFDGPLRGTSASNQAAHLRNGSPLWRT